MIRKNVEVIQEEKSDCGVSCLLSIMKYYNGYESLENLRIASLTDSSGVTAYNLIECARHYGFDCVGLKEYNIDKVNLPYIAHLKIDDALNHFVVVYEKTSDYLTVMDPMYGLIKVKRERFMNSFDGVIISLYPKEKMIKRKYQNVLWQSVLKETKRCRIHVAIMIILNIILVVLSIIYSNYINLINYSKISVIFFIVILFLLKTIEYVIAKMNIFIDNSTGTNIFSAFLNHVFHLPLKILHLKDSGEIIKRVNELEEVKKIVTNFFMVITLSSIYIIFLLISISVFNWKFLPLILLSLMFLLFCVIKRYEKIKGSVNKYLVDSTNFNVTLQDSIDNLVSIKHMNQEKYFLKILKQSYSKNIRSYEEVCSAINKIDYFKNIVLAIVEFSILLFMINDIHQNIFQIQDILVIQLLINYLFSSFNNILEVIPSFIMDKKLMRKINEFYNLSNKDKSGGVFKEGNIKFSDVTFSYNGLTPIIKNVTFEIKKNDKVMIDGVSGSGKSTLMRLLNREYEVNSGKITIGGIDIRNIDINDYRHNVLYLSQDEGFINGTIRENILFGRNIDDKEFYNVVKLCKIDEIIKKYPAKFDTYITRDNNSLSGGEKGLIILARALIAKPKILIIDEVLSELNLESELVILKNMKMLKDITIIYISHKKSDIFKNILNVRKD